VRAVARLVLVVALFTSAVQAEPPSRLEAIVKRGTLRVGMTGDYAPFTTFDPATSTFLGFDVDMGTASARRLASG